jgi:hypothetical protein
MRRPILPALFAVCALALGACSVGSADSSDETPTTSATPGAQATLPAPGGSSTPEPKVEPQWTSGPMTVIHNVAVPPVPLLVAIRSAAHPGEGYDRIVFDFNGPLPGYAIRYVDEVREDPSDRPVTMPGRRYLLVVFTPTQAHTEAGVVTVSPNRMTLNYPMLKGYVVTGDFEAYTSVALGLDDVVGYRVGELPGQPGRIYIDVAA